MCPRPHARFQPSRRECRPANRRGGEGGAGAAGGAGGGGGGGGNVPRAPAGFSAEPQGVPSGESAGANWPLVGRGDEVVVEGRDLARPLVVGSREPGGGFRAR